MYVVIKLDSVWSTSLRRNINVSMLKAINMFPLLITFAYFVLCLIFLEPLR